MSKELTLYDKLLIAEEVIEIMITMKKDQIRDEPNESIWKKQLEQYHIMLGDIMGEKESWFDEDIDKKESDNRRQSEARLEQKVYATKISDKYINKMDPFADYMSANNPHEIEYFDNPISDEVYDLISEYQDKLQKIAEDYDLDNQEINQTVKKVNTFIDKYSDKHMKKWNKYYPQKEVTS